MARPLLPHGLSESLARLSLAAQEATPKILMRLGAVCEGEAKRRIGEGGAHPAGTPTTARKGSGPAVVTGALRRAVTHEMVGLNTVRIGAADIPHPPEKSSWKAPKATSGQISGYLEEAGYPWLAPALKETEALAEAEVAAALRSAALLAGWGP